MKEPRTFEPITADSLVQEVVDRHPQVVSDFVRHRLQCAGCTISPFRTLADSAREYAVAIEPLLKDMNELITTQDAGAGASG